MIIGTMTVPKWIGAAAACVVSAVVAFFLASLSWGFYGKYGIRSPGIFAWDVIVAPDPSTKAAASFGEMFAVQLTVDWLFWFGSMCLVYFVITTLRRRLKG